MSDQSFRSELQRLINRESMEQYSDTPDFILAGYLKRCLEAFDIATVARETYYGRQCGSVKGDPAPEFFTDQEGTIDFQPAFNGNGDRND